MVSGGGALDYRWAAVDVSIKNWQRYYIILLYTLHFLISIFLSSSLMASAQFRDGQGCNDPDCPTSKPPHYFPSRHHPLAAFYFLHFLCSFFFLFDGQLLRYMDIFCGLQALFRSWFWPVLIRKVIARELAFIFISYFGWFHVSELVLEVVKGSQPDTVLAAAMAVQFIH